MYYEEIEIKKMLKWPMFSLVKKEVLKELRQAKKESTGAAYFGIYLRMKNQALEVAKKQKVLKVSAPSPLKQGGKGK